ncbi:MAG: hypothetical protein JNM27_09120 [Leptospirales bacterium]|nr:hypothetical protein [Leptospirales bacterium]
MPDQSRVLKCALWLGGCFALQFMWLYPLEARPSTTVTGELDRSYYQLLFLFDRTTSTGQSEWMLHPFASRYQNSERSYTYTTVLYPTFYLHGTYRWSRWTLLYLFSGEEFYHEDAGDDEDVFLTPILYWGKGDTTRERYFSLFPLYGHIHNKLSYSDIHYVLFPLYASWSHREYEAKGVLWPVVMWGGSPTRSDFRIFPFFSRKVHEGKYERYTVLWPFFQWSREGLDKKEPRSVFLFFPFYGRKWSDDGNMSAHTVLWPLFSWGSDKKTNGFDMNLFWFLFQYGKSDDPHIRKLIVFALYGHYTFGSKGSVKDPDGVYSQQAQFISPFYVRLNTNSALLSSEDTYFIPFFMYARTYYKREREMETYLKIWPLFYVSNSSTGAFSVRSLTLWPFRSDEFDRVWGPYYSIFEYSRFENRDRYFSVLFRIYSRYWNETDEHHFLAGFNVDSSPEKTGFEFLGGFLGFQREYKRMETTRNVFRVLWFSL